VDRRYQINRNYPRHDPHSVRKAHTSMILAFAGAFMAKKAKRRTIRAWSSEDVRSLRGFAKARMSGPQIAKKLKRTPRGGGSEGHELGDQIPICEKEEEVGSTSAPERLGGRGGVPGRSIAHGVAQTGLLGLAWVCMSADLSGGVSFESSNCRETANRSDFSKSQACHTDQCLHRRASESCGAIELSDLCRKGRDSRGFWRKLIILNQ
jgi:hypothetical protein